MTATPSRARGRWFREAVQTKASALQRTLAAQSRPSQMARDSIAAAHAPRSHGRQRTFIPLASSQKSFRPVRAPWQQRGRHGSWLPRQLAQTPEEGKRASVEKNDLNEFQSIQPHRVTSVFLKALMNDSFGFTAHGRPERKSLRRRKAMESLLRVRLPTPSLTTRFFLPRG